MRLAIFGVVLMVSGAASAEPAQQFDLVCKGQRVSGGGQSSPFEVRYRLDLAARRYCEGDCGGVFQIKDVTPDMILLERAEYVEAPLFTPFMEHCRNRTLREQLYRAFITRASAAPFGTVTLIFSTVNSPLTCT